MTIKSVFFSFLVILFIGQSGFAQGGILNLSLLKASEKGDLNQVKELLEKGADVNVKYFTGDTALILAAIKGYKEIVKELLDKGAVVTYKNKNGDTALRSAAIKGHKEIVKELLKRGADVNYKDSNGDTALILAVQQRDKEIVKELLKRGADVNAKYKFEETALMLAVQYRDKEIVKELLDKGAEVNAKNIFKKTALIRAAMNGHKEIEEILKLEQAILEGEVLDNINKLKVEDISWYLQRALNQLDEGNAQIYSLLPNDYKLIVDVYRELMAGNIDKNQIKERLENLKEYYPELKDNTKAYNLLKNSLSAVYNISNEYKIDIIPIVTNILLMYGLGLDS